MVVILTLAMLACRDRGAAVETPARPQPHEHGSLVPGRIVANFVDTITVAGAESLVNDLGLTPLNFSSYGIDTLHSGVIGVPVGDEQLWVDSLKTYTSYITDAGRLAVMQQPATPFVE